MGCVRRDGRRHPEDGVSTSLWCDYFACARARPTTATGSTTDQAWNGRATLEQPDQPAEDSRTQAITTNAGISVSSQPFVKASYMGGEQHRARTGGDSKQPTGWCSRSVAGTTYRRSTDVQVFTHARMRLNRN